MRRAKGEARAKPDWAETSREHRAFEFPLAVMISAAAGQRILGTAASRHESLPRSVSPEKHVADERPESGEAEFRIDIMFDNVESKIIEAA